MTVKQILYSLQNCSLGQSAARAPTPATPHHPQFPHKMRRRHLESVSAAPYGLLPFGDSATPKAKGNFGIICVDNPSVTAAPCHLSLRLGHGAALICHRHIIHFRAATSLPLTQGRL